MKKIGILTLPLTDNYGGIIQAAALYHYIKEVGHEPYLIDKKFNKTKIRVLIKKLLTHNPFYKIYDYNKHTQRRKSLKNIQLFLDNFFQNRTKVAFDNEGLKNITHDLETIIVGSDQVWRYLYVGENYNQYFLDFVAPNQRKISYAASFGVDFWEGDGKTHQHVSKLLNRFDAVSVREDIGIRICQNTFGFNDAIHVLDPTFLPDVEFYESIIQQKHIVKNIGLFNYVLDASVVKNKIVNDVAASFDYCVSTIHLQEELSRNVLKPCISEWLYHLKNADYIITDSFHGMVFAIIFNKQFIAIGNRERGASRFESLLNQLNIKSRLIFEEDNSTVNFLLNTPIDYITVNKKLRSAKEISKQYLLNNI